MHSSRMGMPGNAWFKASAIFRFSDALNACPTIARSGLPAVVSWSIVGIHAKETTAWPAFSSINCRVVLRTAVAAMDRILAIGSGRLSCS